MGLINDMISELEEKASNYDKLLNELITIVMKYIPTPEQPHDPVPFEYTKEYAYEYKCTKSKQKKGRKDGKKGCGSVNLHRTKRKITFKSNHLAECSTCGKRTRLNPDNVKLINKEA